MKLAWSIVALVCSLPAAADSFYSIGNSLTNDMQPYGIAAMATQRGHSVELGYHIRSSASLDYIWNNPADVTFSYPGTYDTALPLGWDSVTVQPFANMGSTLGSDIEAIENFVSLMPGSPSVYVYAAWPSTLAFQNEGFAEYWQQPVSASASQSTVLQNEYFDHLYTQLNDRLGTSVYVIPVGDVLGRLDQDIRGGLFTQLTSVESLYRDALHMGEVGRFIAGATAYATIFGEDPTGILVPSIYQTGQGSVELTQELADALTPLIWDVVSHDIRTGVTPVPLPAAAWLLLSGLSLLALPRRRNIKYQQSQAAG